MTFDSRPETWLSKAVTRSRVASELAAASAFNIVGATVCVEARSVMAKVGWGVGTWMGTLLGMDMGLLR